jgi:hypothetical protein
MLGAQSNKSHLLMQVGFVLILAKVQQIDIMHTPCLMFNDLRARGVQFYRVCILRLLEKLKNSTFPH